MIAILTGATQVTTLSMAAFYDEDREKIVSFKGVFQKFGYWVLSLIERPEGPRHGAVLRVTIECSHR